MRKYDENNITKPSLAKAINLVGGVVSLGDALGISFTSVSRWLHTDLPVPLKHAHKIEKLTKKKVKAKDLRPDVLND